jgi:hypothetical protein
MYCNVNKFLVCMTNLKIEILIQIKVILEFTTINCTKMEFDLYMQEADNLREQSFEDINDFDSYMRELDERRQIDRERNAVIAKRWVDLCVITLFRKSLCDLGVYGYGSNIYKPLKYQTQPYSVKAANKRYEELCK